MGSAISTTSSLDWVKSLKLKELQGEVLNELRSKKWKLEEVKNAISKWKKMGAQRFLPVDEMEAVLQEGKRHSKRTSPIKSLDKLSVTNNVESCLQKPPDTSGNLQGANRRERSGNTASSVALSSPSSTDGTPFVPEIALAIKNDLDVETSSSHSVETASAPVSGPEEEEASGRSARRTNSSNSTSSHDSGSCSSSSSIEVAPLLALLCLTSNSSCTGKLGALFTLSDVNSDGLSDFLELEQLCTAIVIAASYLADLGRPNDKEIDDIWRAVLQWMPLTRPTALSYVQFTSYFLSYEPLKALLANCSAPLLRMDSGYREGISDGGGGGVGEVESSAVVKEVDEMRPLRFLTSVTTGGKAGVRPVGSMKVSTRIIVHEDSTVMTPTPPNSPPSTHQKRAPARSSERLRRAHTSPHFEGKEYVAVISAGDSGEVGKGDAAGAGSDVDEDDVSSTAPASPSFSPCHSVGSIAEAAGDAGGVRTPSPVADRADRPNTVRRLLNALSASAGRSGAIVIINTARGADGNNDDNVNVSRQQSASLSPGGAGSKRRLVSPQQSTKSLSGSGHDTFDAMSTSERQLHSRSLSPPSSRSSGAGRRLLSGPHKTSASIRTEVSYSTDNADDGAIPYRSLSARSSGSSSTTARHNGRDSGQVVSGPIGQQDKPRRGSVIVLFDLFLSLSPDDHFTVIAQDLAELLKQRIRGEAESHWQRRLVRAERLEEWIKSGSRRGSKPRPTTSNPDRVGLTLEHVLEICYPESTKLDIMAAQRWMAGSMANYPMYSKAKAQAYEHAGNTLVQVAMVEREIISLMFNVAATTMVMGKKVVIAGDLVKEESLSEEYLTRAGLTVRSALSIQEFAALFLGRQITKEERVDIGESIRYLVDKHVFSIPGMDIPPEDKDMKLDERNMVFSYRRRVRLLTDHVYL